MYHALLKSSIDEIAEFLECGCDPNFTVEMLSLDGPSTNLGTVDWILTRFNARPAQEWNQILALLFIHGVSRKIHFKNLFQKRVDRNVQAMFHLPPLFLLLH